MNILDKIQKMWTRQGLDKRMKRNYIILLVMFSAFAIFFALAIRHDAIKSDVERLRLLQIDDNPNEKYLRQFVNEIQKHLPMPCMHNGDSLTNCYLDKEFIYFDITKEEESYTLFAQDMKSANYFYKNDRTVGLVKIIISYLTDRRIGLSPGSFLPLINTGRELRCVYANRESGNTVEIVVTREDMYIWLNHY